MGVMKYFRHILMGHEIFSKIFDGLRNIFLESIFIILSFKLKGLEHKISKLAIKEIYPADVRQIVVKIKKKCLMHFDPDARVFVLSNSLSENPYMCSL